MSHYKFDTSTARTILEELRKRDIEVAPGLSASEIATIEENLAVQLPPDLRTLLAEGVPVGKDFPDWHADAVHEIQATNELLEKIFSFDISEGNYWHGFFGEKPQNIDEAKKQAWRVIKTWPPLVRIYGHRFMPTEPHEIGNPVLSVWQALDYGANLTAYFEKEFDIVVPHEDGPIQKVSFWGDAFGL
jgi:hypothetical protein